MKNEFKRLQKAVLLMLFLCNGLLFSQEAENLYASVDDTHVVVLEPSYTSAITNKTFEKKYHYLVARAYFKLLAEAQKSERKLRLEYERLSTENEKGNRKFTRAFRKKYQMALAKYQAHSAMLRGLKSWNLFSDDRTGDMFYFMAENEDRVYTMYKGKLPEDKVVKYLIYKLADLYHVEGEK